MSGKLLAQPSGSSPGRDGSTHEPQRDQKSKDLDLSFISPFANSTESSSSVPTVRNTAGVQSPALDLRTPSFPFPTIGVESATPNPTPPIHLPFTALSPTVAPERSGLTASRLAKSRIADAFKASGRITPTTPVGRVLPDALEIAVRLQTEPGLAGWWHQTSQILRESFSATRASLAIPSDKTEIENVPWAQLAEYVAGSDDDDHSKVSAEAGSIRSNSLLNEPSPEEAQQENSASVLRIPGAPTSQRPRLGTRHSYAGISRKSPASEVPLVLRQRPRFTRAETQSAIASGVAETRSVLDLGRLIRNDSVLSPLSEDTTTSSAASARVLEIPRPLEADAEPLITSAGVVRVLNNSSATILTRKYNIQDDQYSLRSQRTSSSGSQTKSYGDDADMKTRTRGNTASTNSSNGRISYEDFEQIPGTPWAQSPAPSPAPVPETDDNPFFNSASVKESFRKNPPTVQYQAGQHFEAIGLDTSHSIIQLPLIHPSTMLSQPQRLHRFRVDRGKDKRESGQRAATNDQASAERKRKIPLAILSVLIPIVPVPQECIQLLNSLSPVLATSFYAATQHANLQKEVNGLSHERNRAISRAPLRVMHTDSMGSEIFSPLSSSSAEYSNMGTPQGSEKLTIDTKGSGSDRQKARTPSARTPSSAVDREGYFSAVQETRRERVPSRHTSVRSKNGHSTSQKKPHSTLHSQGASFHKTHPSQPTATALGQSEDEQSENDAVSQQFKEPSTSMLRSMIDIGATQHLIAEPDNGRLLWVNSKFQAYRNTAPGQKLDDQLWNNIYPKDRKNFRREWNHALETGEQLSQQVRMERFDGQFRWFHLKFLPLKNDLGVIKYWSGQAMDIHDLHEAEVKAAKSKEKAASEAKYRAIANSLPVIVFAASVPAGMTFANTQWLSYSGQSLEQALGFGFLEHVHPEDLHKCRFPRVSGGASILDAFKRESREAGRWSSLQRSDSTTSSAGDSDANSAITDKTARPPQGDHSEEKSPDVEIPGELLKNLAREGIILCAKDGQGNLSITTEMRLKSKDNEYRWHLVQGSYIESVNFGSGDAQWFIACTDISSQKKNEAKIQEANSALESVNSALETEMQRKMGYLSSMSHEIRTPLNSIIGNLQFLVQSGLEESALEWAHGAKEAATGMHELINDILDLSKAEANMLKLQPHWFNPRDLGEQIMDVLNPKAAGKKVELCQETLPGVPLAIRGDSGRIRQVLLNLATNAIKFTNRGEVIVKCELLHEEPTGPDMIPLKDNEIYIRWTVTDTGIGFTQEDSKLLFKPYSQIRNKATRDSGGTGLGLVLCKTMVHLHGGQIEATSVPGQGSVFSFYAKFRIRNDSMLPSALPSPTLTAPRPVSISAALLKQELTVPVARSPGSLHGSAQSRDSPPLLSDSSTSALSIRSSTYQKSLRSSVSTLDSIRPQSPLKLSLPANEIVASSHKTTPSGTQSAPISPKTQIPGNISQIAASKATKDDSEEEDISSEATGFRPPMLSILVICPPIETRRITCARIQSVVPKSVACNIASESSMAAANELLFGDEPAIFTHVVIRTVVDDDAQACVKKILDSPMHQKVCIVLLSDQDQFMNIKEGLPKVDFDNLHQAGRVRKVIKPAHQSKLARIFDPDNENRTATNDPKETKRKAGEKRTKEDFKLFKKALGGKGLRVVAVEDDKMQMNVLNSFLSKVCGMTPTQTFNGRECLDLYLQHGPGYYSVIVSDTQMPVMNGLTMCRLIRQEELERGWPPINIVSLSANILTKGWAEASDAGFSHYCGKPVSFSELGRILVEVTDPLVPHVFLRDRHKPRALLKALGELNEDEDDEDEDGEEDD